MSKVEFKIGDQAAKAVLVARRNQYVQGAYTARCAALADGVDGRLIQLAMRLEEEAKHCEQKWERQEFSITYGGKGKGE